MKKFYWTALLLGCVLLFAQCANSTGKKTPEKEPVQVETVISNTVDTAVFNSIATMVQSNGIDTLSVDQKVIAIGECLLQTPYVAHTLEGDGAEVLRINLDELDCTTFLESVVALTRVFSSDEVNFSGFAQQLQFVRYREGKIQNYSSRLHYFSDWLYENEKKGIIINKTKSLGGVPFTTKVSFMSSNPDKYLALKDDSLMVAQMHAIEGEINNRSTYYIPKDKIESLENRIGNGYLIAITTNIPGLDLVHVGIAYHVNGRLHFMHASSAEGKVVISDKPLVDMLKKRSYQTGIMVAKVI